MNRDAADGIYNRRQRTLNLTTEMDGYYHRNPFISSSWDQRYSSSSYDYNTPQGVYVNRRGSLPSGKFHGFLPSSGSTGGFYGSGGNMSECGHGSMEPQNTQDNSKTNLIVNYLPQSMSEKELYALFVGFGPIESCRIVKDYKTGYSYGFGFVNFMREEDAMAAIAQLNGYAIQNKRLKVSFARPSGEEIKDTNLYVTGLPRDISDQQLDVIFGKYGRIVQKHILRDKMTGHTRGVAFVRYNKREEAQEAISALNNVIPDRGTEPLVVRLAEEHGKKKAAYYAGWMAGAQNRGNVWNFSGMDMFQSPPFPNNCNNAPPPLIPNMQQANNFYGGGRGFGNFDLFQTSPFGGKNNNMMGGPKMGRGGMRGIGNRGMQRGPRNSPWGPSGDDKNKNFRNKNKNLM